MQWIIGVVAVAALAGLAVAAGVWAYQRSMVYRFAPDQSQPAELGLAGVGVHRFAAADGTQLAAWVRPPAPGKPVILSFHGNFAAIGPSFQRLMPLTEDGTGLAMMVYRGSWGIDGPMTETAMMADATAFYDALDAMLPAPVPAARRVIHGFSLGTSPAVWLAGQRPAAGLIVEAGFDSLCRYQQARTGGLPLCRLMWAERHDTIRQIGAAALPKLFVHGARDRAILPEWGEALFQAAPAPKRQVILPEGAHADLMRQGLAPVIAGFIAEVAPASTGP